MTLQQIRDKFVLEYKLAARLNKLDYIEIDDPFIIDLINRAEGDIQTANLVNKNEYEITLNDDEVQEYTLPTDFQLLDEFHEADRCDGVTSTVYRNDDGEAIILFPDGKPSDETYTVKYYPYYFAKHSALTEDLNLPDKYQNAIIFYLMSKVIGSFINVYDRELRVQKQRSTTTKPRNIRYSLGGINNASTGR